jgi:adenosylcobinamide-phosphate synthase
VQLVFAYFLDLAIGDPSWLPHPVVWIGRFIHFLEKRLLKLTRPDNVLLWCGAALTFIVVAATVLSTVLAVHAAAKIHPVAGQLLTVLLLAATLASRSLAEAAAGVYRELAAGNLDAGRLAVSRIVGRDTGTMSAGEVARATVETVAENTVDGVTAPLFYALVGGLPLAMAYKAVNTLDSMLGYKNERYIYFGRTAARLDDLANWLPARLTVPVMIMAAAILRLDAKSAWRTVRRDGRLHPSPNSGLTEALVAGALGATLGGMNSYHGSVSARPLLGAGGRTVESEDIISTTRLMWLTYVLFLILGLAVRALFHYFTGK